MAASLLLYQSWPTIKCLCTSTACGATCSKCFYLPRARPFSKSALQRTHAFPAFWKESSTLPAITSTKDLPSHFINTKTITYIFGLIIDCHLTL